MKPVLLAFLLFPFYASAQLEVGVNGGASPFRIVRTDASYPFSTPPFSTPKNKGIYGLNASFKLGNIKLGVGYNASTLYFTSPRSATTYYYAKPMSDIYLSADYEWHVYWSFLYMGINTGLTSIKGNNYMFTEGATGTGISYGAHIGYSFRLYKNLWANAQAGFTYADNTFIPLYNNTGYALPSREEVIVTYPLTVGLHYKLNLKKHKKPAAVK